MARAQTRTKKKKEKKNIPTGVAHIKATFNNTLVTITDPAGNVISWSSAGVQGFKGSRKGTPFAAQLAAQDAARKAMDHGMRNVDVFVKGPGAGREAALRALQAAGLSVNLIRDVSPIPHNGCRPPKRRRVEWRGDREWLDMWDQIAGFAAGRGCSCISKGIAVTRTNAASSCVITRRDSMASGGASFRTTAPSSVRSRR